MSTRSTLTVAPARSLWRGLPAARLVPAIIRSPRSTRQPAWAVADDTGTVSRRRPDKARRHGSCRRQLYRSRHHRRHHRCSARHCAGSAPNCGTPAGGSASGGGGGGCCERRWSRWQWYFDRRGVGGGSAPPVAVPESAIGFGVGIPRANRSEHRGKHRTRRFPPSGDMVMTPTPAGRW